MANNKKQKAKGKGKKPKSSKRGQARAMKARVHISQCAIEYGLALMDPFNIKARGACIPDDKAFPVRRLTVSGRFSGVVGTNGFGYATFNPFAAVANNAIPVYTSIAGTTDTSSTLFDGCTDQAHTSNSPFDSSAFGLDLAQYRVVGGGLKISDTSPALTSGGTLYVVSCAAADLNDTSLSDAYAYPSTRVMPYRGCVAQVNYFPATPTDVEFQTSVANTMPIKGAICIQAAPGVTPNLTFTGEFVIHYEISGLVAGKEAVHVDPIAYAGSRNQAASLADSGTAKNNQSEEDVIEGIFAAIQYASGVVNTARSVADAVRMFSV
jgi:hypothetical protein